MHKLILETCASFLRVCHTFLRKFFPGTRNLHQIERSSIIRCGYKFLVLFFVARFLERVSPALLQQLANWR